MRYMTKNRFVMALHFSAVLAGCSSSTYPPPSFEKKVDVSKPGVLYEGDFTVPYNGAFAPSKLELGVPHTGYELVMKIADTVPGRFEKETKQDEEVLKKTSNRDTSTSMEKVVGFWGDDYFFKRPNAQELKIHTWSVKHPGAPIRLKITLTPHPRARKPIEYIKAIDRGTGRIAILNPEQPLDLVLNLATFAQDGNPGPQQEKLLLLFRDLQLHGEYHLRIENLDPVILPEGIETTLMQREARVAK